MVTIRRAFERMNFIQGSVGVAGCDGPESLTCGKTTLMLSLTGFS